MSYKKPAGRYNTRYSEHVSGNTEFHAVISNKVMGESMP